LLVDSDTVAVVDDDGVEVGVVDRKAIARVLEG
jgi:hypothetical protein